MSQQISTLATEYLYRNLVIPYEDSDEEWQLLKQVLDSKGLQHVRTVTLGSSSYRDDTLITPRSLHIPVDELISRLPKHSLKSFRYGPMGRPSDEGIRDPWQRQANLTNLQLDVADRESSIKKGVHIDTETILSLKFVTELKIDLDLELIISPSWSTKLLDLLPSVRTQKVIVCAPGLTFRRLTDWQHLTDVICQQMLPNSLTHINLTYTAFATSNLLQLDDYQSLKHLEFHRCCNLKVVLDSYLRPALSTLIIEFDDFRRQQTYRDFSAVEYFLGRFSSLQKLILVARRYWFEARSLAESVANHGQTLESLLLSIAGDNSLLRKLSLRCSRLSRLVTMSKVSLRIQTISSLPWLSLPHFKIQS